MKKLVLIVFVIYSCGVTKKHAHNTRIDADIIYKTGEYLHAAEIYEKSYKLFSKIKTRDKNERASFHRSRAYISFQLGAIYQEIREYQKARRWYNISMRLKYFEKNPIIYYNFANIKKSLGKIEEAKELYKNFLLVEPNDLNAKLGVESCETLEKWEQDVDKSEFKEIIKKKLVNSKFKDYSLAVGDDFGTELYFTSNRVDAKTDENEVYGDIFTNIFFVKKNSKGKWTEPKSIKNSKISTSFSDGVTSFSNDFSTMFFTHCEKTIVDENSCIIRVATRTDDGWSEPEDVIIDSIGNATVGHPSINADGDTLYFSSDLHGGFGGNDIWYTTKNDSSWNVPVNMGNTINTKMDEVFPYIRQQDNKFFFSSNGHLGMGGLDIYEVDNIEGTKTVVNLKPPLNSRSDDFSIYFDVTEKYYHTGYFSSNRGYISKSDNIYSFARYPKEYVLRVYVVDSETKEPIEGAKLKIAGTNGIDKNDILTNVKGLVNIPLSEETKYIYAARKKNYLIDIGYSTTIGIEKDYKDILDTLFLVSTKKPIIIPNIYYKINSYLLQESSFSSLDTLYLIMKNNPDITIQLRSHSDFSGSFNHNLALSQKRAQSVVNYLITKKIKKSRLSPLGLGETEPLLINEKLVAKYKFLDKTLLNKKLDSTVIMNLSPEFQNVAKELNRRTDLKVINE